MKKIQLYDRSKIDFQNLLFDRNALMKLLIPLMAEQLLNTLMGMMDTIMVSRCGSAAISAVSLVDSINVLVIQVFAALATGGTIICSFYIGRNNKDKTNVAAEQIVMVNIVFSTVLTVAALVFRVPLLRLTFGKVEADVMENSITYFLITALSYPFIALSNCGAAFLQGRRRKPFSDDNICTLQRCEHRRQCHPYLWPADGSRRSRLCHFVLKSPERSDPPGHASQGQTADRSQKVPDFTSLAHHS